MSDPKTESRTRSDRFAKVTVRGILSSAGSIAAGVVVSVLAAGGTYAILNDQVTISPATITSGTVGLTVTQAGGMNVTGLVPGASVVSTFTASNTGNADLSVAVTTTTLTSQELDLASHLSLKLAPVDGVAACTAAVAGGAQGPLIGFTSTTNPVVIGDKTSQLYCLVATLSPSAPVGVQGGTAGFTLNLEGLQVTP